MKCVEKEPVLWFTPTSSSANARRVLSPVQYTALPYVFLEN